MKYFGLAIVGLAVGATVAAAIGFVVYTNPVRPVWPAQSASLNLPSIKQRQELAQLHKDLETLQKNALVRTQLPQSGQIQSAQMFALPPTAPITTPVQAERKVSVAAKTARVLPTVSVILRSGFQGTAVIDDRVTQVGESVAGGLVVKAIEAQRVIFVDKSKREVVVDLPVHRMGSIAAFPSAKESR